MTVAQDVRSVVMRGKPGEVEENLECIAQELKVFSKECQTKNQFKQTIKCYDKYFHGIFEN